MVAIIDYGAGNLRSISKAIARLGLECAVTDDPGSIEAAGAVVLPGVGAFGAAARRLKDTGADQALLKAVETGRPILGICLGMQLLFEESEESPGVPGLGVLGGRVERLRGGMRVPHLGWNTADDACGPLFAGIVEEGAAGRGPWFYFAHSYVVRPADRSIVSSTTEHGERFPSSIRSRNVFGVQFHPEKSGSTGLRLLLNFLNWGLQVADNTRN